MAKKLPDKYLTPTGDAGMRDALDRVLKAKAAGTYTASTTPKLTDVNALLANLVAYATAARLLADNAKSNYPDA